MDEVTSGEVRRLEPAAAERMTGACDKNESIANLPFPWLRVIAPGALGGVAVGVVAWLARVMAGARLAKAVG